MNVWWLKPDLMRSFAKGRTKNKKGREPPQFSACRGTAKHPNATEIAKGTHPLGASTKTISLHSETWRFCYMRNISNAIFYLCLRTITGQNRLSKT